MTSRSQLYPLARQLFATGALDWATANIKVCILAAAYTPDFTQQYITGIPSGYIITTSDNIAGKTGAAGYLDGDTTSLGVVDSPALAGYLLLYQDTGTPSTSPLVLFLDTPDIPGMPQVLDGFEYFIYANLTYGGWARL